MKKKKNFNKMFQMIKKLFPINRSILNKGNLETLNIIKKYIPIKILSVPSGYKAFDWTVPLEWNISEAWIKDKIGKKIIDFKDNNLHVVNYSSPFKGRLKLKDLKKNLHTIPKKPNAIPYVTSYYHKNWGFCLEYNKFTKLKNEYYDVYIDSNFKKGKLRYGEILIKGKSKKEILLTTYICHPSMANNELSGPALLTELTSKILSNKKRFYSYRIIFIPETIGSIVYIKKNYQTLKKNTIAGFVITCVGDEGNFSYLESKYGNTLADRSARTILNYYAKKFKTYSFIERGSDERQFCSPNVDLPVCSIMRSKHGKYKEYHTSLDNLDFISIKALDESLMIYSKIISLIEINFNYKSKYLCEPQMSKRNLYPKIGKNKKDLTTKKIMNVLTYCDGNNDIIKLSEILNTDPFEINEIIKILLKEKLIYK